jgi:predicted ester cyclase
MNDQAVTRLALAPAVARMLERSQATGGEMLRKFLRYGEALVSADPSALDLVVEPNARLHDLEAMGLPPGLAGLKLFRQMINSAFPDERPELLRIELEGNNIVAAELKATGTHRGELMGIPPTGRVATWLIHARVRFHGDKVAERWDVVDVDDLMSQLTTADRPSPSDPVATSGQAPD